MSESTTFGCAYTVVPCQGNNHESDRDATIFALIHIMDATKNSIKKSFIFFFYAKNAKGVITIKEKH